MDTVWIQYMRVLYMWVHVGVLEMCPQFRGVFMEGFRYKCVLS